MRSTFGQRGDGRRVFGAGTLGGGTAAGTGASRSTPDQWLGATSARGASRTGARERTVNAPLSTARRSGSSWI